MACASYIPDSAKQNSDLVEEIAVLREIYLDEIVIEDSSEGLCTIKFNVHPSTGENTDKKLVSLVLVVIPDEKYPDVLPKLYLTCPRGLSDSYLTNLHADLIQLASGQFGFPMIYTLVEFVRESLTNNNIPSMECMICLNEFKADSPDIVKSPCSHYYHAGCLYDYNSHIEKEQDVTEKSNDITVPCPICRLPFTTDLSRFPAVSSNFQDDPKFRYVPSKEMLKMREDMQALFLRQKERGGIIDLEEEKNKYLITL